MITAILFLSGLLLYITVSFLLTPKTVPPTAQKTVTILNRKTYQTVTIVAGTMLLLIAYGVRHFMSLHNMQMVQLTSLLGLFSWGLMLRFGSKL